MRDEARVVHLVGHGHIDPAWLWPWYEGYEEVRATFRSALARMEETPEFRFTASSACFYRWFQESEPELFAQLRARVAEGRWEIAGGMWIEPDCNVPCGEALVRQGLYAQRYFRATFGRRARVGFNPDSFGHPATLPQLLRGLGMDRYVFMRPMPESEWQWPGASTFHWRSADGACVLTCNLLISYNADTELEEHVEALASSRFLNPGQRHVLGFFGVGNHGGGPTRAAIRRIEEAIAHRARPERRFAHLAEYFDHFLREPPDMVPEVSGELQHHARGCYSACAPIKRLNRSVEHALMNVERWATVAWLEGLMEYPKAALEEAWKTLLFNQFHDILAGTCIERACEEAMDQLRGARASAQMLGNRIHQAVAREIDTRGDGNCVVVFNPLPWPVRDLAVVSPIADRCVAPPLALRDDRGALVPMQTLRGEAVGGVCHAFVAELPGLGYRCYRMQHGGPEALSAGLRHARVAVEGGELGRVSAATALPSAEGATARNAIENARWRLELAENVAGIAQLVDKAKGDSVLLAAPLLAAIPDASDTWSHGLTRYSEPERHFEVSRLVLVEAGPVLTTLRCECELGASGAEAEFTLYADLPWLDLRLRVNWQHPQHVLKLLLRTSCVSPRILSEAPYGWVRRAASGEEAPTQQWLIMEDTERSFRLAVMNDGIYGYDALAGLLRLSLLRSPGHAQHDPAPFVPGAGVNIMDLGVHEWRFRVMPFAGDAARGAAIRAAWQLNAPPFAHVESAHAGMRPPTDSFLSSDDVQTLVTVFKRAEEGDDIIVRMLHLGEAARVTRLDFAHWGATRRVVLGAAEIHTQRLARDLKSGVPVNMLEEESSDERS